jgi:hypothetical protein
MKRIVFLLGLFAAAGQWIAAADTRARSRP